MKVPRLDLSQVKRDSEDDDDDDEDEQSKQKQKKGCSKDITY